MRKKRKLKAREVAVCFRIRDTLLRLQRITVEEPAPTVEEYRAMDRTVMLMEVAGANAVR